eukprot:4603912-Lingulodinium_polyedra.AAC.1
MVFVPEVRLPQPHQAERLPPAHDGHASKRVVAGCRRRGDPHHLLGEGQVVVLHLQACVAGQVEERVVHVALLQPPPPEEHRHHVELHTGGLDVDRMLHARDPGIERAGD